ncbi:MAG: phosphoribosylanthranilate isomerase [Porphyromonadaceae bacterium]
MLIKVCGMRNAENIRAVTELNIDMIGFIFNPKSPRFVRMISARAGIIPDYSEERLKTLKKNKEEDLGDKTSVACSTPQRVGVFMDAMPQTIITRIYNYNLDYVQLNGDESSIMIDNLKRSVDPDIHPGLKVIKKISISNKTDMEKWREYEGYADMLLFDMTCKDGERSTEQPDFSILDNYNGKIPFLLSREFRPEDVETVRQINHPMLAGIDVNNMFETEPGVKDVEKLGAFVEKVRN